MQVNSSSSQLQQLMNQRNKSIIEMVQDVQSGNIAGAQSALGQVNTASQSLGIGTSADGGSSKTSSTTPSAGLTGMKNDLTAIMSAVQSGDLTSAQAAWSKVQANMASGAPQGSMPPPPSAFSSIDGTSSADGSTTDAATNDLTTLLNAVQSGDTDAMKSSATAFAKDLKTVLGSNAESGTSTASTSSNSSTGNPILDDLNALVQEAQSGDASSAQAAQQKLNQDMQSTQQAQGAGHAHHHHHHGGAGKTETASQTTAATTALAADGTSPDSATTTATEVDTIPA